MLKFRTANIIFGIALAVLLIFDLSGYVPPWSYIILAVLYLTVQAYGSAVLSAEFFMSVRSRGNAGSRNIALTFDDGPIPGQTEAILDVLESYKVPAAFFCIGNRVSQNPGLLRRIHQSGHMIGNHSYWHKPTFDLQTAGAIEKELEETDQSIVKAIGLKPALFRPPYGVTNPMLAKAVKRRGYKTIGWSVRSFDTVIKDGSVLMERITRSLKGGDVILLHDYSLSTLEILPALLDHIEKVGLKIVRVDELLNEKAYV